MNLDRARNRGLFPTCVIADVPPPPAGEALETFRRTFLSDLYIHEGEPEFDDRLARAVDIQFARWRWACENLDTYVNMLRVAGHDDVKIDAMATGGVPMSFANIEDYGLFKFALLHVRALLEEEEGTGLRNVRFAHTGSSVPGFSSNPLKGFAELPSKITAVGKSDVDLVFIADGVRAAALGMIDRGRSLRQYPTTMGDRSGDTRYGVWKDDIAEMSPLLHEFIVRWEERLSAEIQVTFQESPTAPLPPWENEVVLIEAPAA